jgi:hypothetical protein
MTCLYMKRDKRGCLLLRVGLRTNWQYNYCDFGMLISSNSCNKLTTVEFLFTVCTRFEQCTYLGYATLEASRKYVLHGLLLNIY